MNPLIGAEKLSWLGQRGDAGDVRGKPLKSDRGGPEPEGPCQAEKWPSADSWQESAGQ